ncbi:hypothetical protein ARMSODRAFT_982425 [Armillaria solidipes]|uniref:Uncharacterized protein n=1 Tax=Armillaria solidipes TaxID=1076256 RepID=A0A2H3ANC6_9AGAR|nr:hypothetical protein ARMSODRAFT_982425 [Armillaria solidipes]
MYCMGIEREEAVVDECSCITAMGMARSRTALLGVHIALSPDRQCEEHRSSHKCGPYDFKKQCMDPMFSNSGEDSKLENIQRELHYLYTVSNCVNQIHLKTVTNFPNTKGSGNYKQSISVAMIPLESGITTKDNEHKYSTLKAHSLLGPDRIWAVLMGINSYLSYPLCSTRYLWSEEDGDTDFNEEQDVKPSQKFVEALCPVDRNTLDISGKFITDITDRELNAILVHISRMKENQITFILDCCHMGSVTRTISQGMQTVPLLKGLSLKDMLLAADNALRNLSGPVFVSIVTEDWKPDIDSHVIMAACMENEVAKARQVKKEGMEVWRGIFTNLLLNTLRSGVLKDRATYVDLINALPQLCSQTPVTVGSCNNARL